MIKLLFNSLARFSTSIIIRFSFSPFVKICRKLINLLRFLLLKDPVTRRTPENRNTKKTQTRTSTISIASYSIVILTIAITCAGCSLPINPVNPINPKLIKLTQSSAPFYSLHLSDDLLEWIVIFGDRSDLTLKLARGPIDTAKASVTSITTIDRVDVSPGVNPNFGMHVYLQENGFEHLFYSDQILADSHVIKWIYRHKDRTSPWMVEHFANGDLPLAAFQTAGTEPGFTLFHITNHADKQIETQTIHASRIRPVSTEKLPVFSIDTTRLVETISNNQETPKGYWQRIRPYSCVGRNGFALSHDTSIKLLDREQIVTQLSVDFSKPWAIVCETDNLLIVYAREEPHTMLTSSGTTLKAHEIIALEIDSSNQAGAETKVTLARDIGVLAAFLNPEITVLFSELALDTKGVPKYHLSLITPTDNGEYSKYILWQGANQLEDIRALLGFGQLIVTFRKANELYMLKTKLTDGSTTGWQKSGSY